MRKSYLFFTLIFLLSGCCHVQSIGLVASERGRVGKDYLEVWLPFGIFHSSMGMDFLYLRREIPYNMDTETDVRNALNELLKGPTEAEKEKGAYSLVNAKARILDLKIKRGKATINFSKEFAPAGGTLAIWQCTIAVEEVLRQFPQIKQVDFFVEGIPAIESLQP